MRLAVFTVSPHRSYANLCVPMIPAVTGPELIPVRKASRRPSTGFVAVWSRIRRARSAIAWAWSGRGRGTPAATMYASPTVLIFSRRRSATKPSKHEKTSSSSPTSSAGDIAADIGVKSTTSANRTDAASTSSAIVALEVFSRATISSGRMLCGSSSERAWYRSRYLRKYPSTARTRTPEPIWLKAASAVGFVGT